MKMLSKQLFDPNSKIYLFLTFFCCWFGGMFAGMNAHLFSVLAPEVVKQLTNNSMPEIISSYAAWALSIFLVGWFFGGLLFGFLADHFGRKKALVLSVMIYALSSGMISISYAWWQIVVWRFVTGIGVGGQMVSISVFINEVWPQKSRASAVAAAITSYQAGVFYAGSITWLFPYWRIAFAIGASSFFLALLICFVLEESRQWQESVLQQAQSITSAKVSLFSGPELISLVVGGISFGSFLLAYWASVAWVPAWIQVLLHGHNAGQKELATMYHGIAAIMGCYSAGYIYSERLQPLLIAFFFCIAWILSACMFLSLNHFSVAIYILYAAIGFCIGWLQAAFYVYLPTLFSVFVRAKGTGICLNGGRLVTALLVLFMGTLVTFIGNYAQALFIFSCGYLIGAFALSVYFYCKTKMQEQGPLNSLDTYGR